MSETPENLGDYLRVYLPYCLMQLADGRYVATNRNYKPIGSATKAWVNYEELPDTAKLSIPQKLRERVDWRGKPGDDRIYLYDDASKPTASAANWAAYQARLELLATCKVGQ